MLFGRSLRFGVSCLGVVIVAAACLRIVSELLQSMGTSSSKHDQAWQPSPPGGAKERMYSKSGYDITPLSTAEIEAAAAKLTPFQREVALQSGTERAFTGKTVDGAPYDNKRAGLYVGSVGGLPLFRSEQKYDSGTGWPSFWAPVDPDHVIEKQDFSIPFMPRIEVLDARSGAHLGHGRCMVV